MKFDNKIGSLFNNISQRVIYPYIITYPDFIPIENNSVSREAQRQMHEFMKETLLTVYSNPEIIGMSTEKDDYFDWEAFKDKPDLNNMMKKLEKKFLGFFALLYEIGINGEISNGELFINKSKKVLNKGKILQLSEIGLICTDNGDGVYIHSSDYPELSAGWKLLSNICMESENKKKDAVISQSITKLLFMKCIFSKDHVSFTRLYGDLPQSGKYLKELESFFKNKGYTYEFFDATFCLIKKYPQKQEGFFEIKFNWRKKNQLNYEIKVPGFTGLVTQHFNDMSVMLKELIYYRLKTCDGCGYCTQTNKTAKKVLAVQLDANGNKAVKCPLYPWLVWENLDGETVLIIKELIDFSENYIIQHRD